MTEWTKHDGSIVPPVLPNVKVKIETYASIPVDTFYAYWIDWRNVKWYKIVKDD